MWIKVCGICDVPTARVVGECGADAVGLNFYERTPRHVDVPTAEKIVDILPPNVTPVGVFVNHSASEIRSICEMCGLRTVQLHGDEPAPLIAELGEFRVIRALRTDGEFEALARQRSAEEIHIGRRSWAWLVDARSPDAYGGTGETVDWEPLAMHRGESAWPPLILAGGLTPNNITAAIEAARPWGVDVASGVESAPGIKDVKLVEAFLRRARDAS